MKLRLRPAQTRRHIGIGWLKGAHSFNNEQNRFDPLVVLNEDEIAPMHGFPLHPHKNFEIFTYMLEGELTHTDSMGSQQLCGKGSVQFVSAGKGIEHGEFNSNPREFVKALQIWVAPRSFNTTPRYQIKQFKHQEKLNQLCQFIAPKEVVESKTVQNSIGIDQDFYGFSSVLENGKIINYTLHPNRQVFIHLPGNLNVELKIKSGNDSLQLKGGDGAYITNTTNNSSSENFSIEAGGGDTVSCEFVLFDMVVTQQ